MKPSFLDPSMSYPFTVEETWELTARAAWIVRDKHFEPFEPEQGNRLLFAAWMVYHGKLSEGR